MGNGLSLTLDEFRSLPEEKKLDCLYQNQVKTLELVKGYKFHQKTQYVVLATCVSAIGFLFKLAMGV